MAEEHIDGHIEYYASGTQYVPQELPLETVYTPLEITRKPSSTGNPKTEYTRNKEIYSFLGHSITRGTYLDINLNQLEPLQPVQFYSHPHGEIWVGDAITWLGTLAEESVDLIFADPPYNIKKAEWDTFESQQEYVNWSLTWIEQAARVLKPTGTLYICGFSEILADLKPPASHFFQGCRWIMWHYKNKANHRD